MCLKNASKLNDKTNYMYIMSCNAPNYQNSMGYSSDGRTYSISGNWEISEECFKVLDTETPKGKTHTAD